MDRRIELRDFNEVGFPEVADLLYLRAQVRTAANQTQLIAWGLALQFCQFGMWSVLYAYTPELYPTRARATGAGCASAIGRLGSLLGPYAVGRILPLAGQGGVFALGAGTFLIAALTGLLLGVETRGKTLEAISA